MNKILGITIATVAAISLAAPAYADEVEIDCETNPTDQACIMLLDQETPAPATNAAPKPTDYPADPDDTEIVEEDIEEESEPAMWPVYISFAALGAAVLTFIILNLFGGRKKK